jgi:hypothetical protein
MARYGVVRSFISFRYGENDQMHTTNDLRDEFMDFVEEHMILRSTKRDVIDDERCRPLLGALWNCTDTMPGSLCTDLGVHQGSTYAQGVRNLARD